MWRNGHRHRCFSVGTSALPPFSKYTRLSGGCQGQERGSSQIPVQSNNLQVDAMPTGMWCELQGSQKAETGSQRKLKTKSVWGEGSLREAETRVRRRTSVGFVRADREAGRLLFFFFLFSSFWCMHGFDSLSLFFSFNIHRSRWLMCGCELLSLNWGSLNKR